METVKGFNDYTGEQAIKRAKIKKIIEKNFQLYGFEPAETPIIEQKEFVIKDNQNDEAVRDVFKLQDRGKRELALRYEFTFQLKRIAQNQKLPYKRYQIGYIFRDEPIKKGRTRQFIQADADIIQSTKKDEAECLALASKILQELNIDFEILINNRKLINEILENENIKDKDKEQVIREIDKLDKQSEVEVKKQLKQYNAGNILTLLKNKDKLKKLKSYQEIKELQESCKLYNLKTTFSPTLARGLSYYNGSVFEIKSKSIPVSIAGGGSYLINNTQSTGISFGFEPIFLIANLKQEQNKILIISINQDKKSIELAEKLRKNNKQTILLTNKSVSKALDYANSKLIQNVIILGDKEAKKSKYTLKNMKTGKEKLTSLKDIIKL